MFKSQRPTANMKVASLMLRTVLTQVKQQHLGLLGPKVLAASPKLSSFCFDTSSLHTRKLLVWEAAQRENPNTATAEEGNSSPGPCLGSRALQQDLAPVCFPTACPGMKSGAKSCELHDQFTGSDRAKHKHFILRVLLVTTDTLLDAQTCTAWGVRADPQHVWGKTSLAEQNRTKFGFVF